GAGGHALAVAAVTAGRAGHVRGVPGGGSLDVWPGQRGQQRSATLGRAHGLARCGPVVERAADVLFESPELVDERGLVRAEMGRGCLDGGEGHGDLEPAQPVPALPVSGPEVKRSGLGVADRFLSGLGAWPILLPALIAAVVCG